MHRSTFACLGIIFALFFSISAKAHPCAANLTPEKLPPLNQDLLQAELEVVSNLRPFVVTYPFVNQAGHQVLVVIGHKTFPLSKQCPIAEIRTPQNLTERWQAWRGKFPNFYTLTQSTFTEVLHRGRTLAILRDPGLKKIEQAAVVFVPFLTTPKLKNEDDPAERGQLAEIHQDHLKTVIKVMHHLGYRSALSDLFVQLYEQMQITDNIIQYDKISRQKKPDHTSLVQRLAWQADQKIHDGRYGSELRLMQQFLQTGGERIVWTSAKTFRNPRLYRQRELLWQNMDASLAKAGQLMERREELAKQGHSEDEIEEILYPDPAQRAARKALSAKLQSNDWFRVDDP
ncbi:MAG: hypothetical protein J6Y94_02530 [Bacteriovoracaceae bacterium]|nr:hypothetical protein [Bacteriovoracaceae bacterium]